MFYWDNIVLRSDNLPLPHGFSAKAGGVSTHPYTATLNLAMGREDSDEIVRENIARFARAIEPGCGADDAVCAPQIHSAIVRKVGVENRGEGVTRPALSSGDGFVTDEAGVLIFVRVADCTPILLAGYKADKSPVIAAVHAGWRGTAKGIAASAVEAMVELGCERDSIHAAIGPHIGSCCYEVGADLYDEVAALRGEAFARTYITPSKNREGKFFCDMTGMNRAILCAAGVREDAIDVSPDCTFCQSGTYYSHRKTAGKRGAMGAGILIPAE